MNEIGTCKNCKAWQSEKRTVLVDGHKYGWCDCKDESKGLQIITPPDFGCIYWESLD
jgi:hypothetical protein